jgi:hypothetical protein
MGGHASQVRAAAAPGADDADVDFLVGGVAAGQPRREDRQAAAADFRQSRRVMRRLILALLSFHKAATGGRVVS